LEGTVAINGDFSSWEYGAVAIVPITRSTQNPQLFSLRLRSID
jgi:hypothetical protein